MSTPEELLGRGIAFPMRADGSGSIALVTGAEGIEASLRMVLGTAPGERVMRPEFGCRVWDLVYEPVNANTLGLMEQAVRDAVGQWEPRIDLEDVVVEPDPRTPARLHLRLWYRIRTTNDRRNLVFPFYVIPPEEPA